MTWGSFLEAVCCIICICSCWLLRVLWSSLVCIWRYIVPWCSFQSENTKFQPFAQTDIEVTGEQIASGLIAAPLQVRRGSEPALNQLVAATGGGTISTAAGARAGGGPPAASSVTDPSKRWSATPIIVDDEDEVKEKRSSHQKVIPDLMAACRLLSLPCGSSWSIIVVHCSFGLCPSPMHEVQRNNVMLCNALSSKTFKFLLIIFSLLFSHVSSPVTSPLESLVYPTR